ncbi:MAG: orotidine-5'-phosphate decarboxylase [Gemmatimonadota bacterium]
MPADRIIVALDVPNAREALRLVERLGDAVRRYKIGSQIFTAAGPPIVKTLVKQGKGIFLDLKFHDIPNTVAGAVRAAADLGVEMLTVHATGGPRMLAAAQEAAGPDGPRVLAVTLLTSLGSDDVSRIFGRASVSMVDDVVRLAGLAADAGVFGVVASVNEVKSIRRRHAGALRVVTPGIRLAADEPGGDQTRYATPQDAARAGADYIVVGRSVTSAKDPAAAFREVAGALDAGP